MRNFPQHRLSLYIIPGNQTMILEFFLASTILQVDLWEQTIKLGASKNQEITKQILVKLVIA